MKISWNLPKISLELCWKFVALDVWTHTLYNPVSGVNLTFGPWLSAHIRVCVACFTEFIWILSHAV